MAVKLNNRAFEHATKLIEQGNFVFLFWRNGRLSHRLVLTIRIMVYEPAAQEQSATTHRILSCGAVAPWEKWGK